MVARSLRSDQRGEGSGLLIGLVLVSLLFIGAAAFAVWAFQGRQDYKNNVDQKIAAANLVAVKNEDAKKDAAFAEASKSPLKTYNGPSDYGSITMGYPKTWSAYVDETASSTDVNGYFSPGFVPSLTAQSSTFALRFQVMNQDYGNVLKTYASLVQTGKVTSAPYALPMLPKVVGVKITGQLLNSGTNTKSGTIVILPLRDKTVELWTESPNYQHDFDTYILPNFSFSP